MASSSKKRLDVLLVERGLAGSRAKAQALILAGRVRVPGHPTLKPGSTFEPDVELHVREAPAYASRGGLKLAEALDVFQIDVAGKVALDVGASTGGFTDVLLQRGATRVYAVDVGYGQLDYRLRVDPRVVVMERTNIRLLNTLPERPMICTIDVSFISLRLVLPAVAQLIDPVADTIALVKPQFEAGRHLVGRGVVRSPGVWRQVLVGLASWLRGHDWRLVGLIASPVTGAAGNVEFLAHLRRGAGEASVDALVEPALAQAQALAAR